MLKSSPDPGIIALSTSLYRLLLALYPAQFKRDYRQQMAQVFRDCCWQAYLEGGSLALLELWARTALDYLKTIVEEYARGGTNMTREKFIRLSGWAMILGPLLLLVGSVANNRPEYDRLIASSLPIDRYANVADTPLILAGLVFMSLGLLGVMLRYTPRWGGASFLLGMSALAGFVSALGSGMSAINEEGDWWMVWILGMAVQYLALAIFGIVNLRRRFLPRWNGLPVLALWFPIAFILSSGLIPWEITNQMLAGLWGISCVMFAGLGYLLQSDPQPGGISAAPA